MQIPSNFGSTLDDFTFSGSQRVESRNLDQQDFLKLMLEQLRNQNPLEPQDNSGFFSQMAQFDTLETMHEIATALRSLAATSELANATSLVGRTVTATIPSLPDPETGIPGEPEFVQGVVDRVTFSLNGAVVHIGDRQVPSFLITEVA